MTTRPTWHVETISLWALSGVLAALAAFIFFFHQPAGPQFWSVPRDDFYYYLKIAMNLAHGHGSTFNGIVPTNGYHPLYLLALTVVCWFTESIDSVLNAVWLLAIVSAVVTFHLAYRILGCFSDRAAACLAAACFLAMAFLDMYRDGMEVILAVPLALALVLCLVREGEWSVRRCFSTSLLASLMVLARIDSVLLVGLVFLLLAGSRQVRAACTRAKLTAAVAGLVPVVLYLAINVLHFHTLLPVSGEAKEVRLNHGFSSVAYSSVAFLTVHEHRHLVPAVLALVGLLLAPLALRRCNVVRRAVLMALLALPWLQLTVLSFLSDWKLWSWYLYTFNLAACAALCLLLVVGSIRQRRMIALVLAVCMFVVATAEGRQMVVHRVSGDTPQVRNGLQLAQFAQTHPGIYAMGDLAGFAGMVVPDPIIQTEGLVMDPAFLRKVRRQQDLIVALRSYGVRYYVSTIDFTASDTPCFHAIEPVRAGPTSAHMSADICAPPLYSYNASYWRTRIYDLDALPH